MSIYENFAEVYDIFMQNAPYKSWALYIQKIWKTFGLKPSLIIELGCGTGNITNLLAKKGYNIIGIDNSCAMLSKAKQKAKDLNILYINQDIRKLNLLKKADCIISICDTINYILKEEELLHVFKLINNYLKEEGLFIFDINTYYKFKHILSNNTFSETKENAAYTLENFFDIETKINEFYTNFFIKDENTNMYHRFEEIHYQKAYSIKTIKALIKKAGLKFIAVYDDLTFDYPKRNSERIFFVITK